MVTQESERPEPNEKAPARTGRRSGGETATAATNRISYQTRTGDAISVPVDNIPDVDEIVASGVWDVPQGKKEDVENIPIVILDAMHMTGKYDPYYIALCGYLEDFESAKENPEFFTIPFNGTVLPKKMGALMGEDFETGKPLQNARRRIPAKGKLVQIDGESQRYWDFRRPSWTPEDDEAEKPRLVRRS